MRDQKHRSPLGSGNAAERFAVAGIALGEAREKNRESQWPIVVEGKRDRIALQALQFVGPIEVLNRGWGLDALSHTSTNNTVRVALMEGRAFAC